MKIIIHDLVKQKIRDTARFIHQEFGVVARSNFNTEINHIVKLLRNNPGLGPAERYLEGTSVLYRSIVVQRLNKIIYWVNDDVIEIVDFWDCRREPIAQAAHLK
ncbi:MAG: type II toxin-antitoxin system RelE/ParE family toxin [Bacteroidales bacterium]|nr:type II toxin-antitoxin system RelE/ParE family toxin [Bacteroidales bacterium]